MLGLTHGLRVVWRCYHLLANHVEGFLLSFTRVGEGTVMHLDESLEAELSVGSFQTIMPRIMELPAKVAEGWDYARP